MTNRNDPHQEQATVISNAVSVNMRRMRKKRGWSRPQLVEELTAAGCPVRLITLANLELGRRAEVSVDLTVALGRVFGVSVEDLCSASLCDTCSGLPPAGFTCNDCGKRGAA